MCNVLFDVQHLYYLPMYLPVAEALVEQGVTCQFVLHNEPDFDEVKAAKLDEYGFDYCFISGKEVAFDFYQACHADWIIFGNAPPFNTEQKTAIAAKLALMQHGIGPKSCYYTVSEFPFDVRFVEGQNRLSRLQALYPNSEFIDTGFAKLDPLFGAKPPMMSLSQLQLDPTKPTILYAPTFFPSSIERFDADWPEQLSGYNVIIKPHFFSMSKEKYASQREKIAAWSSYPNVYVAQKADFCLLPFMQIADVMLSDASSAMFEFAALDKPVVWCDFLKTRWSYMGIFSFRLKKRLDPDIELFRDIAHHAKQPKQANKMIAECLTSPHNKQSQRQAVTRDMVGATDGQCAQRIADYLIN